MREILFRGKCDGGWKHGSLHIEQGETDQHGNSSLDYRILGMRGECYYVIPETVGQYAGVTDENGTKIFEGDILLVKYSDFVGNDAECRVFLTDMTDFEVMGRIDTANEVEVIGNIHDNPEPPEGGSNGMEDLLNSEPAWRQSMTAQINVFVNEVAQKTEDLIVAKMTEHLTAHGYDKQIEINGANLRACIEKQIPKKPNITLRGTTGWNTESHCPVCKTMVHSGYCSGCGQAIDWEK